MPQQCNVATRLISRAAARVVREPGEFLHIPWVSAQDTEYNAVLLTRKAQVIRALYLVIWGRWSRREIPSPEIG